MIYNIPLSDKPLVDLLQYLLRFTPRLHPDTTASVEYIRATHRDCCAGTVTQDAMQPTTERVWLAHHPDGRFTILGPADRFGSESEALQSLRKWTFAFITLVVVEIQKRLE